MHTLWALTSCRRRRGAGAAGLAVAGVAALTVLSACGGAATTASGSPGAAVPGSTGAAASGSTGAAVPGSTSTPAGAPGGAGRTKRLAAFDTCMESKGIPAVALPTGRPRAAGTTPPATTAGRPGSSGGGFGGGAGGFGGGLARVPTSLPKGVTQARYSSALQACRADLPTFGGNASGSRAFIAYRQCLQLHGVTFPAGPTSIAAGATTTTVAPATRQAALSACAALRPTTGLPLGAPARAGGTGASSTTTTAAG